jgi:hypothetical protein
MDLYRALEWYIRKQHSTYSCGEKYETLDWHEDNELIKPSKEDLELAWEEYLQNKEDTNYKSQRSAEYPPIEAQLDLIYREGLEHWMDVIQGIKKKYPNPRASVTPKSLMKKTPMQEQIESLNTKMDSLTKKVEVQQLNAKDIQLITDEIKAGMFAIKGFMMEIPNIQKQLAEIESKLEVNS